jgi:methyl-accepting chemotaxis protein
MRLSGWLRIFRRKAAGKGPELKAWRETLGQVIADLDLLNRNTEQDFLRIGGKLFEFTEAVDLISSELTALADMMSAEQGLCASQALTSILDDLTKMKAGAEEGDGLLDGMLRKAGQAKRTLFAFKGTVSILATLGVLTRIETARLGAASADFLPLADDVKSLSGSVQERVEHALDTARQLIPPIESALISSAALEKRKTNDLPSMISEVLAQLASFADMQKRAHDSSVRMRSQSGAISDAFKKLVVSIQFHDITRQQVEHVIEILRRLSPDSEGQEGGISRDPRSAAAVLALQSSQLADAGEKFAASAASIARGLDDIAAHVLEMVEESRSLSGFSGVEKDSFLLRMEQSCSAILAGLVQCDSAEAANGATYGGLAETIGRVRGAIEKIQTVEIQMERLALNASIRTAHIGGSGDALAVLAGTMQQLALESRGRSESLLQALGCMSQAAARLAAGRASADSAQCEETVRTAIAELHSSSERSFARIGQITVRSTRLCEDLSAARESFTVGPVFAEAVRRAREMLQEMASQNQFAFSPPGAEAVGRDLDDFARHYTMQAERDVHEGVAKAVAGPAPAAAQVEQSEFPPKAAEELGENVEFF